MVSGASVKAGIYREANEWCANQGLVMVPLYETSQDGIMDVRQASAELRFRAVQPGDVEDERPNLRPVADTVVEIR